jgi:diadenosine tetraphosphate (Ap4A) HIT family hydrolase
MNALRTVARDCPICSRGRPLDVIAEYPAIWVTAEREAPLPGYVCLVSKLHVSEPHELEGSSRRGFWDDVSAAAAAIQQATGSPKLNYEIHGNTIPHLHVHLYPRFRGDPFEGRAIEPRTASPFVRTDSDLARLAGALASDIQRR